MQFTCTLFTIRTQLTFFVLSQPGVIINYLFFITYAELMYIIINFGIYNF